MIRKLIKYDIYPSVIKSRKQMTYNKVNEILEKNTIPEGYEEYADTLKLMNELAHIIRGERTSRGSIDFDTEEAKILVDENCVPTEISLRYRGEGERLIEDFMVRANETVATHFYNMDLPSVYRVHGEPSMERLIKFLNIINALGMNIKLDSKKMSPMVIQKLVNDLKKLEKGIKIDDYKTSPCKVKLKSYDKKTNTSLVLITIHEGHNHQVKKMFEVVGYDVKKLTRLSFAGLDVKSLKSGEYRKLSLKEVQRLYSLVK